jgi:hypothetical protein
LFKKFFIYFLIVILGQVAGIQSFPVILWQAKRDPRIWQSYIPHKNHPFGIYLHPVILGFASGIQPFPVILGFVSGIQPFPVILGLVPGIHAARSEHTLAHPAERARSNPFGNVGGNCLCRDIGFNGDSAV